ncbi:MAG: replicative DNA helicase [Prolixibacteraceae bacterium]
MKNTFDKIPPQAIEEEQAVLGALMLEQSAFSKVSSILTVDTFYEPRHQVIYRAILGVVSAGKPVDLLIVTRELKDQNELENIGGAWYITQLAGKVSAAAHIEQHAAIIAQTYIARRVITITSERGSQAYDTSIDVADILSGLQNDLLSLVQIGHGNETTIADGLVEIQNRIAFNQKKTGLSGLGTGLAKLDKKTGGLQKTDLVIIAGDSSQGKTSLALTILKNAVMTGGARCAVYSLEMSSAQLIARILSTETGIPSNEILGTCLTYEEAEKIERSTVKLSSLPVYFDEGSNSTIDQICSSIRRLVIKKKINLVIVDFLQLVASDKRNRTEEGQIAEVARRLKNIAKELSITVIALSQFSRDASNPRPAVTRLRGSGQIVESADLVLLIWRPEVYKIQVFSDPFSGTPSAGLAECIIAKGRNVGTGTFLLRFNPETTGFYDYDPKYIPGDYNPNKTTQPSEKNIDNEPFVNTG